MFDGAKFNVLNHHNNDNNYYAFTQDFYQKLNEGTNMSMEITQTSNPGGSMSMSVDNSSVGSSDALIGHPGLKSLHNNAYSPSVGQSVFRPRKVMHPLNNDAIAHALMDSRYPTEGLANYEEWTINLRNLHMGPPFAQGAFGKLYKGTYNGVDVAIKILERPENSLENAQFMEQQFQKEVTMLANLKHPNIVRFIGACRKPMVWCIVTEYAKGGSVRQFLTKRQNRAVPLKIAVKQALDVARGMAYIHARNFIHRDLKSAKTRKGRKKILSSALLLATEMTSVFVPYNRSSEKAGSSSSVESDSSPVDAVIFAGVSLLLGTACRQLFNGTRVPYTVLLLVIGIVLGALEYGTHHNLGKIGNGIRIWNDIDPDLLLAVFLPALLFESSFSMDVHQIKRCIGQMVLLAGPGVLISTFCIGSLLKLTFPYDWDWKTSLLLGGLLGATDPVAVVALLKELGASKKMTTLIDGESLMNDGVSVVVFQLFLKMVMGNNSDWGFIIKFLAQNSFGAVGIGVAFGIASVLWLRFVFNDIVVQITVTLSVSYFAYYTAQEWAGVSGILTVMTLGMFFAAFARTAFKGDSHQSLHHFWEMVAYIANTLVFILSGVIIAEGDFSSRKISYEGKSWGFLFLLYVYVQLARCVVVGVLYPLLRRFGYGLDWKESIILTWSGLRGAVSLSLALSVKQSSGSSYLSSETGTRFLFFTGGIVFLTLVVNGSTTQLLLHLLHMDSLTATKERILEYTKYEMMNTALKAFENLGDDEELGSADWHTVVGHISSLNDLEGGQVNPQNGYGAGSADPTNIMDIRIRFLNGVQAAYWEMLDDGRITQNTANVLMQSVDEALDLVSTESLCDWRGLKPCVHFPKYYGFLQSRIIPRKLVSYLIVERLESACYISSAFLRAHRIARQQLHGFLGNSDIASIVINESEVQGQEAKQFLVDVRDSFPQVLNVLKTRQVTHYVLNHLNGYIKNLEKVGLLEGKEVSHLHDAVQADLKKLLRNPPLLKLPNANDLITTNPLLRPL